MQKSKMDLIPAVDRVASSSSSRHGDDNNFNRLLKMIENVQISMARMSGDVGALRSRIDPQEILQVIWSMINGSLHPEEGHIMAAISDVKNSRELAGCDQISQIKQILDQILRRMDDTSSSADSEVHEADKMWVKLDDKIWRLEGDFERLQEQFGRLENEVERLKSQETLSNEQALAKDRGDTLQTFFNNKSVYQAGGPPRDGRIVKTRLGSALGARRNLYLGRMPSNLYTSSNHHEVPPALNSTKTQHASLGLFDAESATIGRVDDSYPMSLAALVAGDHHQPLYPSTTSQTGNQDAKSRVHGSNKATAGQLPKDIHLPQVQVASRPLSLSDITNAIPKHDRGKPAAPDSRNSNKLSSDPSSTYAIANNNFTSKHYCYGPNSNLRSEFEEDHVTAKTHHGFDPDPSDYGEDVGDDDKTVTGNGSNDNIEGRGVLGERYNNYRQY